MVQLQTLRRGKLIGQNWASAYPWAHGKHRAARVHMPLEMRNEMWTCSFWERRILLKWPIHFKIQLLLYILLKIFVIFFPSGAGLFCSSIKILAWLQCFVSEVLLLFSVWIDLVTSTLFHLTLFMFKFQIKWLFRARTPSICFYHPYPRWDQFCLFVWFFFWSERKKGSEFRN